MNTTTKPQPTRRAFRVLPWDTRSPFSVTGGDTRGEAAADRRVKAALAERNQITEETRFTLTPEGYAALAEGYAALAEGYAALAEDAAPVETVRQCWDGERAEPKPEWIRGTCPECGAALVSNCYYIGGRGFVIIFECWESLRHPAACTFRQVP